MNPGGLWWAGAVETEARLSTRPSDHTPGSVVPSLGMGPPAVPMPTTSQQPGTARGGPY